MEKQAELTNPRSCLNKAEPFEPIFVIRAKDPLAAQAVRLWATMAAGRHEEHKVGEAMALAEQMEKWRAANVPEACIADSRPREEASRLPPGRVIF